MDYSYANGKPYDIRFYATQLHIVFNIPYTASSIWPLTERTYSYIEFEAVMCPQ